MHYDFNNEIPRAGTDSVKYDLRKVIFGKEDVIPMWVADMDFAVPPFVSDAIKKRAEHPVYGYSIIPDSYYSALINWQKKRFGWELKKEWIHYTPGVVTGLNVIVQALTDPGDKIIVQPPVYFPFFSAVKNNGRTLVYNQLVETEGKYTIDFDDLESKMKDGAKMLIICNPHNPVSRCWTRSELEKLAACSLKHGAILVSDEIHCDLVLEPHRHIPIATLSEEIAKNTVTCIAPSKTFNLAGLFTSSIIISDEKLREKFMVAVEKIHLSPNVFGITAAEAAYREGEEWLSELLSYIKNNADHARDFFADYLPQITVSPAEATYMLWLDFRKYGLPAQAVRQRIIHEAGIGFVEGTAFGPGGEGFQRMNVACPRSTLERALESLRTVFRH